MVVFNGRNARISRDEVVERGMDMANQGHLPWLYKLKVKSGRRRTENEEYSAMNLPHLKALVVIDHGREREVLSAYAIQRIMKSQLRSIAEDR